MINSARRESNAPSAADTAAASEAARERDEMAGRGEAKPQGKVVQDYAPAAEEQYRWVVVSNILDQTVPTLRRPRGAALYLLTE